ncbi:MAG: type II secretion system major pseudopilin GspG [Phycisphaeraceae bacterium]|nr:type II secretion system major pseudopilin GspG [Phycisphaerales bacterium]MCB9861414.1 type II secretion system major pseudopilin GspG [Phycisphaeraceae bacterium]
MQKKTNIKRAARSAFTLVEVIVIVTILGVIAAVVATRLTGAIGKSKAKMAAANAASLYSALEQFEIDHGELESGDTIDILWDRPGDVAEADWEPYVKNAEALLDPWGNKYVLQVPGNKNPYDFDVISYGADGQPGGEGDSTDIVR